MASNASDEATRGRDPVRDDIEAEPSSERTPLLLRESSHGATDQSQPTREHSASGLLRALSSRDGGSGKGSSRRWPSLLALLLLCVVATLIMIFAFITPSVVEKYAQQAVIFEPTSLSIDSFTSDGVRARVQGNFMMDASKVDEKNVRNIGRLATWFAREIKTGESDLEVSLPEYGNVVLGTADVPPIKVSIRNGHNTHVDFLTDLQPGDVDGIRRIAKDWIDGRLGQLRVIGKANVPLKSGIFNLGKQIIQQEMTFANDDIPTMPQYKIKKLNFREVDIPSGTGMAADVALIVKNDYPIDFTIPPLGFGILVDNCQKDEPYIMIADALTHDIHIHPQEDVELNVTGNVRQLPDSFIEACPGSHESPLDSIVGKYMSGKDTTIYVQGSESPSEDTPDWVTDLMKDITVPVSLPGHSFGSLIKNFTLDDTHFGLPDPFADPTKPESNPRISANIKAVVALPEEMNFNISVGRVRADADVFYKGKKLGKLDLHKWQQANSTRLAPESEDDGPSLLVQSSINDAPLNITDDDVFTDVVQALLFGSKSVFLSIKALVDVETETALGAFAIRKIPAEGQVPVKPISHGGNGSTGDAIDSKLQPKVFNMNIIDTTETSLTISALVNLTNPTNYSATVPYVDINILNNNTLLGHATVKDLYIGPGNNTNIPVVAYWDPATLGGKPGAAVGREFLSQYISGWNTTLTLQTHNGTIPALPTLGRALSQFPVTFNTPRLGGSDPPPSHDPNPDPPKKEGPHFIEDATFHLIGSSATFTLLSPLKSSTLYVTSINATAIYKHNPAGKILYDVPFAVPPVDEWGNGIITPRLPVDWSFGSVGYEAVKRALGGSLKLGAEATVGVRIGRWVEEVWFIGGGIGARVRL